MGGAGQVEREVQVGGAGQVEEGSAGGSGWTSGGGKCRWEGLDKWRGEVQVGVAGQMEEGSAGGRGWTAGYVHKTSQVTS